MSKTDPREKCPKSAPKSLAAQIRLRPIRTGPSSITPVVIVRRRCLLVSLSAVVLLLVSSPCHGSTDNSTTTALAWTGPTDEYPTTLAPAASGNDTAAKPSKFDEHVEDWQYVDNPLKNVTDAPNDVTVTTAVALLPQPAACKNCAVKSTVAANKSRNKRNHHAAAGVAVAANPHRRFKTKFAQHRAHLQAVTAAKQSYRRKRFRRSAVAAYPNGAIRPYGGHSQPQQYDPSLARRRRYRYAAAVADASSPYYHNHQQQQYYRHRQRSTAAPWDREFRRRYLRFPPTHDAPPPSGHYGNPWSPSAVGPGLPPPPQPPSQLQPSFGYHALPPAPPMGPRSPRLVFRDPVDAGTLQAPFGGGSGPAGPNGLQDLLASQADDVKGQCPLQVA